MTNNERPSRLENLTAGCQLTLAEERGRPERVHVFDEDSVSAVKAALCARRPLLVRGEPGVGKTQLAEATAKWLQWAFIPHVVDSRTETRDLLFDVDTVARLGRAQLLGAMGRGTDDHQALEQQLAIEHFVRPGPLWWAFDWEGAKAQAEASGSRLLVKSKLADPTKGRVLLIDEIDKAETEVPNGLLDAFGNGEFAAPSLAARNAARAEGPARPATVCADDVPLLVIITTNEERSLPDAFLRRCLVLSVRLPDWDAKLSKQQRREALTKLFLQRGRAHFPSTKQVSDTVLAKAAELVIDDRFRETEQGETRAKSGQAEFLDLVRAVTGQAEDEAKQLALLEVCAKFVLSKHDDWWPS